MDQMGMIERQRYITGKGNHSGGSGVFGENFSAQVCDDFYTTSTGYVITEVEIGNLTFGLERPATAWVSIYEVARGSGRDAYPKESTLYDARHEVTTNIAFHDRVFGLVGVRSTISDLSISLTPNTQYFISVQTESEDWAFVALGSIENGSDSYLRDNGRNGYKGWYGFSTWRSHASESGGFFEVDAAYRIEAVPEPLATGLLLMLAVAALRVRWRCSG